MNPRSVIHVINGGEGVGGAERMLSRLVQTGDPSRLHHMVLTILPCAYLEYEMRRAGVDYASLEVGLGLRPQSLRAWRGLLRKTRSADLFVGWLNHGNALASVLGPIFGGVPVVLNFRNTPDADDFRRPIMKAVRALAPRATRRLANSEAAVARLEEAGFGDIDFIHNGFSAAEFLRDPVRGARFRHEHNIPEGAFLFGHMGRFDPLKNQRGLVESSLRVLKQDANTHVMLVGRGITPALGPHVSIAAGEQRIHLVDGVDEPQDAYSAFDAYVHSSDREGFPNAIAEAMLHCLPVVCTRAGESSAIAGADNWIVPCGDEAALTSAMVEVLRLPNEQRTALGARNRERISSLYSIERVTEEFERHFIDAMGAV